MVEKLRLGFFTFFYLKVSSAGADSIKQPNCDLSLNSFEFSTDTFKSVSWIAWPDKFLFPHRLNAQAYSQIFNSSNQPELSEPR